MPSSAYTRIARPRSPLVMGMRTQATSVVLLTQQNPRGIGRAAGKACIPGPLSAGDRQELAGVQPILINNEPHLFYNNTVKDRDDIDIGERRLRQFIKGSLKVGNKKDGAVIRDLNGWRVIGDQRFPLVPTRRSCSTCEFVRYPRSGAPTYAPTPVPPSPARPMAISNSTLPMPAFVRMCAKSDRASARPSRSQATPQAPTATMAASTSTADSTPAPRTTVVRSSPPQTHSGMHATSCLNLYVQARSHIAPCARSSLSESCPGGRRRRASAPGAWSGRGGSGSPTWRCMAATSARDHFDLLPRSTFSQPQRTDTAAHGMDEQQGSGVVHKMAWRGTVF